MNELKVLVYMSGDGSDWFSNNESADRFSDYLSEIYAPVVIGGIEYSYGHVLKSADLVRFELDRLDWLDGLVEYDGWWANDMEWDDYLALLDTRK